MTEVGRQGDLRSETITVNMGPQHPSTHGVLNIVIELDGETIVSAKPTETTLMWFGTFSPRPSSRHLARIALLSTPRSLAS